MKNVILAIALVISVTGQVGLAGSTGSARVSDRDGRKVLLVQGAAAQELYEHLELIEDEVPVVGKSKKGEGIACHMGGSPRSGAMCFLSIDDQGRVTRP